MHKVKSITTVMFLCTFIVNAQQINLTEYSKKANKITQEGMLILGGWGLSNVLYNGIELRNTTGEAKAFHQMNLGWGAINVTLAGIGIFNARKKNYPKTQLETLEIQHNIEKTFLVNTALDVAYVAGGYAITQYGENQIEVSKRDRNIGFGKSVMLQGGFLFLFDAVMYGVHRKHYKENRLQFMNFGNSVGFHYSL